MVIRAVLKLPNRGATSVLRAVRCLGRVSVRKVGLRLLRILHNASLTTSCRGKLFRACRQSRCVSLLVGYLRRLEPSVIVRHVANSNPGSLLVTPL